MPLEEVLAAVPELRDAPGGRAAHGRADEHELQGHERVRLLRRPDLGKDTSLLAIDRENEVLQHRRRGRDRRRRRRSWRRSLSTTRSCSASSRAR